jgi:hypothetical protein
MVYPYHQCFGLKRRYSGSGLAQQLAKQTKMKPMRPGMNILIVEYLLELEHEDSDCRKEFGRIDYLKRLIYD